MFVGHALLAFALAALVAGAAGRPPERALALGAVAGAFAALPDVDILYALAGPLTVDSSGPLALANAFWRTGSVVHRTVTHSLVVAPPVALAAVAWGQGVRASGVRGYAARAAGVALVAGLVAGVTAESGVLGGAITAIFGAAALAVGTEAARRTDASASELLAVALFGLWSHPFGDLFTGTPPSFFYPFDVTLFAHRVTLFFDPTLDLLAAFGLELAVVWLGVAVFVYLAGVQPSVTPRATVGAGYAVAALVIPAPTLDLSYPFVFTVLAIGFVGALPRVSLERGGPVASVELPGPETALLTGLTAVTLAWLAYIVAYVSVGGV